MSKCIDPLLLGHVLLSKTNIILKKLEEERNYKKDEDYERDKSKKVKVISEIYQELDNLRKLSREEVCEGGRVLVDQANDAQPTTCLPIEDISVHLQPSLYPLNQRTVTANDNMVERDISFNGNLKISESNDDFRESANKTTLEQELERKIESTADRSITTMPENSSFFHELANKIARLEQELESMKILRSYELSNVQKLSKIGDNVGVGSDLVLLDIVSSQSSSPAKKSLISKDGRTFRTTCNPVGEKSVQDVNLLPSLSSKSQMQNFGRTFRKINSGRERIFHDTERINLKESLIETERILDRGFKTASELSEKLEAFKLKKRRRRNVALQVSIPTKEDRNCEHDLYVCGLVEQLTTLLVDEQDVANMPKMTPRKNTRHVVVSEIPKSKNPMPGQSLAAQRLPDNIIANALSLQPLPSVHISPCPSNQEAFTRNVKIYDVKYSASSLREVDNVMSKTSVNDKAKGSSLSEVPASPGIDVSVQAQSFNHQCKQNKNIPVEKRIDLLSKELTGMQSQLLRDMEPTNKLDDLMEKIQASGNKCRPFWKKTLFSHKPASNSEVHEEGKSDTLSSSRLQVISNAEKPKAELEADDYNSDFEVESLLIDESVGKLKTSFPADRDVGLEEKFRDGGPSIATLVASSSPARVLCEPPVSLTKSNISRISSKSEENTSRNKSLIDEQMKRLGLTNRLSSPRRTKIRSHSRYSAREETPNAEILSNLGNSCYQNQTLYLKSNGRYVPVESFKAPNVKIIVPEIVVKIPDAMKMPQDNRRLSSPKTSSRLRPVHKQDQVIQTDEGCGTLTSGEASSVVEKLNKHFERTQLLLERVGATSRRSLDEMPARDGILDLLHKRGVAINEKWDELQYMARSKNCRSVKSCGKEIHPTFGKHVSQYQSESSSSRSEGEVVYNGNSVISRSQSIGEVLEDGSR